MYLCTALIYVLPYPEQELYFVLGGLIGCLLPDVDHRESIAGHVIPLWLIFKHGKQTHTLLTTTIFLIAWYYTKNDVWYGIWFGYIGHLMADHLSGNKLKYLYFPFNIFLKKKKTRR